MKKFRHLVLFFIVMVWVSCSKDEDKASDINTDTTGDAGFIRTLDFTNSDLVLNDFNSSFGLNMEVEDGESGNLLESIDVFAQFKDNTSEDSNISSSEVLIKSLEKTQFATGPEGLPNTLLNLGYSELVAALSVENENIKCGDQFLVRLQLNLNNGKSFSSNANNSPEVIGFDTAVSSPFCYTINIINPIPDDLFVGMYQYESLVDGPLGPTFGAPKIVELKQGDSPNARYFEGDYVASRSNEDARKFRFIFTCEGVLFRKNQISSFFTWCPEGNLTGGITFGGPPILLGPADEIGIVSIDGDSFFELSIAEGYEGWDGECGFETVPAKVRFTKVEQYLITTN